MAQRLLDLDPTLVGGMGDAEKAELRAKWYPEMGRNDAETAKFAELVATPVAPFDDCRRINEHRKGWLPPKVRRKNEWQKEDGIGTK